MKRVELIVNIHWITLTKYYQSLYNTIIISPNNLSYEIIEK